MGIFRQFPYSNFHDMNMDWLLNTWKDFSAQFEIWHASVDEALAEFKKYIEDVPFDEYVNDVLNKWLEDGTFDSIIRSIILPQREIIMARQLRYILRPTNGVGIQSCFYYDPFIYTTSTSGNDQIITKGNLNGEVVETHTFSDLGHANSIAIANDKVYVADGSSPKVTVIDFNTWQVLSVITPDNFNNIWSVTAYNDEVYLLGSDINAPTSIMLFAQINPDDSIEIKLSIPNPPNTVRQNMCVKDNSIYILFNIANMVYEYDINTGNMISALYVPEGDGYYPAGEIEDLFVMNGSIYLAGSSYYRYDYSYASNSVVQIFETNIDGATLVQSQNEYSYYQSEARLILTVDDTATPEKNPFDTFTTLEEACLIANYHHTGDIRCLHIDEGCVHLLNGDYNLTMADGDRIITRLWCENSSLYIQSALELHDVNLSRVNIVIHRAYLYGSFSASFSKVEISVSELVNLKSISSQTTDWFFNKILSVNPNLTTGSTNYRTSVHILSNAVDNILLLLKMNGSGATFQAYNTGGIIFLVNTTMVSTQTISQTVGSLTVNYSNGVFSGSVSSSTVIELKQSAFN